MCILKVDIWDNLSKTITFLIWSGILWRIVVAAFADNGGGGVQYSDDLELIHSLYLTLDWSRVVEVGQWRGLIAVVIKSGSDWRNGVFVAQKWICKDYNLPAASLCISCCTCGLRFHQSRMACSSVCLLRRLVSFMSKLIFSSGFSFVILTKKNNAPKPILFTTDYTLQTIITIVAIYFLLFKNLEQLSIPNNVQAAYTKTSLEGLFLCKILRKSIYNLERL